MPSRTTIAQLGTKVDALCAAIKVDREQNAKEHRELGHDMRAVSRTLRGSNGDPGLVAEVGLLKDDRKRRDKHIFALWGGLISLAVGGALLLLRLLVSL